MKKSWLLGGTFAALVIAALLAWATYPWQSLNPDFLFDQFALSDRYQLTRGDKEAAIRIVRDALKSQGLTETPTDPPRDTPEAFTVRDPREVFVTLYLPPLPPTRAMATESNIYRSLRKATHEALRGAKDRGTWLLELDRVAIQVDILQDKGRLRSHAAFYLFFAVEPGVDGLILSRGSKTHYQLPSDVITRGYLTPRVNGRVKGVTKLLERAARDLGVTAKAWKDADMELYRFRTLSIVEPVAGGGTYDFFRGNVLLEASAVTSDRIYQSIVEGAQWLLENARDDGKFNYAYYPNTDLYPKDYNAVRHAGTLYGLFELYRYFQEPRFLQAAQQALPYLYENLKQPGKEEEYLSIPDGKSWPTGAGALGLLALVNMPPEIRPENYVQLEQGIAHFLVAMIDVDGRVFEGYLAAKASKKVKDEPLYYPGETLLALTRYYEQTQDPHWLEAAKRIASRQISAFSLTHEADHWVIQGLYQLYRHTHEAEYAHQALAMADSYIETQCPPNSPPFPDYFGAYRRQNETPRTTRAGSRSEAMTAAVRTAWEIGQDAKPYEDSLLFAAKHQIEQQFRPENAFFLPQPKRALGGYRAGLIDNSLRIDFNQHSAVGLIGALESAVKREGKVPFWKELPIVAADVQPVNGPSPLGTDPSSPASSPAPTSAPKAP